MQIKYISTILTQKNKYVQSKKFSDFLIDLDKAHLQGGKNECC